MIGKKFRRVTKIWPETILKLDEIRQAIQKDTGVIPPRTEILNAWANSEQVRIRTLNYYKRRKGLL